MTKFEVLILGSASAAPTLKRNQTSQLLNVNEQLFLIDCGEGTQLRLRDHKVKFQRINHIFISHLHGDHYLGLVGLLQTMHLLGRTTELTVYGPAPLKEIIDVHLKHSKTTLRYTLHFKQTDHLVSEEILSTDLLTVKTIPLEHKIPCTGFLFKEKTKQRRINVDAIAKYRVPKYTLNKIKNGGDFIDEVNKIAITNKELTLPPLKPRSYAFCSDTRFSEKIIPLIGGVDLLYHEATFMNSEVDRAADTYHSTAAQAASIACKSRVNKLLIGHFSNRYPKLDNLLYEAKTIFENTELALENLSFKIAES